MKPFLYLTCLCFFISCNNSKNTQEFINTSEGKYLFNSNESIDVFFTDDILKIKWRGKNLTPVKVNDSTFYVKEINEKLIFFSTPKVHIELAKKIIYDGEGATKFVTINVKKVDTKKQGKEIAMSIAN